MAKPKAQDKKPAPQSGPDLVQDQAPIKEVKESSVSAGEDYAKHPKFDKFKNQGEK